ncbi:MAG: YfiR family protein [Verrucomicrobiaceae bacterium]|nr:MAG: YfiR family protein [Verrucomicrobiaceae bacterium]
MPRSRAAFTLASRGISNVAQHPIMTRANPEPRESGGKPRRPAGLRCLLFCMLAGISGASAEVSKEYQLKAAFLYNFAKFVEWPARSFPTPDSPLVIGVFRTNPFGAELEKAVKGRKIKGHPIVVTLVPSANAARQAQILFVESAQDTRLAELKAALQGTPVLTVGESGAFARQGGMITFSQQNNSLRFTIDNASARKAGVKISSQLQKLALKPGGEAPP